MYRMLAIVVQVNIWIQALVNREPPQIVMNLREQLTTASFVPLEILFGAVCVLQMPTIVHNVSCMPLEHVLFAWKPTISTEATFALLEMWQTVPFICQALKLAKAAQRRRISFLITFAMQIQLQLPIVSSMILPTTIVFTVPSPIILQAPLHVPL